MSFIPRLYVAELQGTEIDLDKNQSHYLNRVLRLKINDQVKIFGENGEYLCKVSNISKNHTTLAIIEKIREYQQSSTKITLAFAPTKGLGASFVVQKACELGVVSIIPIKTERSVVKSVNLEKLEKVAIEAAEQSERMDIPHIEEMQSLEEMVESNSDKKLLFCYERSEKAETPDLTADDQVLIVIGPEGGFDEQEVKFLKLKQNVYTLRLSDYILKAETACIAAVSIISNAIERL